MTTGEFLALKGRYMALKDPTEYTFICEAFGGYPAWKEFLEQEWVGPIINLWREELALRLRSESLARIMEAAQGDTRDALSANKYLFEAFEEGTQEKKNKVGRPSQEAIAKEARRLVDEDKLRNEAYERIFNNERKVV